MRNYTIVRGDTLWAIATRLRSEGVSGSTNQIVDRLASINNLPNKNLIITGRTLRLPGASDGFTAAPGPAPTGPISGPSVTVPQSGSAADAYRARIAQWAIAQADNPNIGYSQTKGRMGDRTDANGKRYFDCSGLVFSAYKQAGITLGGNWTGAMRDTWRSWATQVPKSLSQMKPGDLILMNGHVVMYTGNGRCVGAQTSNTNFRDQVTTNIDASRYLARGDAIVLRPHVPAGLA